MPTKLRTPGKSVPPSEFSEEFAQGMRNRMYVSFFKYGPVAEAYPDKISAIDSLKQRLRMYEATHNTEYLMDAANFAMIEWMHPAHEDAHFTPTDSDGSPGRVGADGHPTVRKNAHL